MLIDFNAKKLYGFKRRSIPSKYPEKNTFIRPKRFKKFSVCEILVLRMYLHYSARIALIVYKWQIDILSDKPAQKKRRRSEGPLEP